VKVDFESKAIGSPCKIDDVLQNIDGKDKIVCHSDSTMICRHARMSSARSLGLMSEGERKMWLI
jgi:hypothetical protein